MVAGSLALRHEVITNIGHAVTEARDVEDAVPYILKNNKP
jgi:hypothetical protein